MNKIFRINHFHNIWGPQQPYNYSVLCRINADIYNFVSDMLNVDIFQVEHIIPQLKSDIGENK